MKKEVMVNRTSYVPKFLLLNNALLRTLLESVGLDLSFQRPACWDEKKMKQYCDSLINGRAPTPIIIVDIAKSLDQTVPGSEDHAYFNEWLSKGYKYISLDGNNRTVTLLKFFAGEIALPTGKIPVGKDQTVTLDSSNNRWNTLPDSLLHEIVENTGINIYIFTVSSRAEATQLFTNINDGLGLNAQEKRNAIVCDFGQEIRDMVSSSQNALRHIFKKGNPRYVIDELFVKMATFNEQGITSETATKAALNAAYADNSNTYKNFMKSGKSNIRKTVRLVGKYGTPSFKRTKTLFNLFMTVYLIDQEGKKIVDDAKFFEWFVNTEAHREPKVAYTNANGDTWSYDTLGNNSKKLDYEGRLKLIKKDLDKAPATVVATLDEKRIFTKSERYNAWVEQDGKCNCCGKTCPESELYDSDLWHADHIHPHSKGGGTEQDNCQLLCIDCNLSKSDKIAA